MRNTTLDEFDVKLLNLLQENNQLTAQELSETVSLSPVSCSRRVRNLRERGIIIKDVSIVSPEAVGRRLKMIVLVTLEKERADLIDEFKKSMLTTPEVMQCHYVTGDTDFVLIVTAEDMPSYESFTQRLFFENRNVQKFSTLVVMNSVKFGTAIPI